MEHQVHQELAVQVVLQELAEAQEQTEHQVHQELAVQVVLQEHQVQVV